MKVLFDVLQSSWPYTGFQLAFDNLYAYLMVEINELLESYVKIDPQIIH